MSGPDLDSSCCGVENNTHLFPRQSSPEIFIIVIINVIYAALFKTNLQSASHG